MKYNVIILFLCSVLMIGSMSSPKTAGPSSPSCTEPLTWRIASIDPRFELDKNTLKRVMNEAAKLWSDALGQKLMVYSDSGEVALNLIYSDAQKFTDNEQELYQEINNKKLHYQSLQQNYTQLSFKYNRKLASYNETNAQLQKAQEKYKKTASRWNTGVVVSKEEDDKLDKIKDEISRLHRNSEDTLTELNRLITKMQEQSIIINNLLVQLFNYFFLSDDNRYYNREISGCYITSSVITTAFKHIKA